MGDWEHELLWNAIAYAALAGLGLATLAGVYFFAPALRQRWFPIDRLRPAHWTGHDVFLATCIAVGFQELIAAFLFQVGFFTTLIGSAPDAEAPRDERVLYALRCLIISSPMGLTVVLGLLFAVLFARSGSRPHHYGLSWSRWPANAALGVLAFVIFKPVIVGIFALAQLVFPPRSDVFAAFGKLDPPAWEWALFAFHTTITAPLLEEILCRGILQGWLRRATLSGHLMFLSLTLFVTVYFHAGDFASVEAAPVVFVVLLAAGYGVVLYRLARQYSLTEAEIQHWQPRAAEPPLGGSDGATEETLIELRQKIRTYNEERARRWADANARLAVFGSALFFAAIHASWPHPLALFPMGLVLGWLAYRTQSLVGPITFHSLFNLATFIAFYGSAQSPR